MCASRPAVHSVETPSRGNNAENPPIILMKGLPGTPGTRGGLFLRLLQLVSAVIALALGDMASSAGDFTSPAFRYFVAAVSLQCLWSLSLAFVDIYALLVKRGLRNPKVTCLFTIGDGVTHTLTYAAAWASLAITVLVSNDLHNCKKNPCTAFETATIMAFISSFAAAPSFLLNLWTWASRG